MQAPAYIDYIETFGIRTQAAVTVHSIQWFETARYKSPRIDLIVGPKHSPTIPFHKIIAMADSEGAPLQDREGFLSSLILKAGGTLPPVWPDEKIRERVDLPDFTEWAFNIDPAFLSAFDISIENTESDKRGKEYGVMFRGLPQCFDFHTGDLLYAKSNAHNAIYAQVMAATPDTTDKRRKIDGRIEVEIRHSATTKYRYRLSQSDFVKFLQLGEIVADAFPATGVFAPVPAAQDSTKSAMERLRDDMHPVTHEAHIIYFSSNGERSERDISILKASFDASNPQIYARCHMRGENRSFAIRRIQEYVDKETGEIVKDISGFLRELYLSETKTNR